MFSSAAPAVGHSIVASHMFIVSPTFQRDRRVSTFVVDVKRPTTTSMPDEPESCEQLHDISPSDVVLRSATAVTVTFFVEAVGPDVEYRVTFITVPVVWLLLMTQACAVLVA